MTSDEDHMKEFEEFVEKFRATADKHTTTRPRKKLDPRGNLSEWERTIVDVVYKTAKSLNIDERDVYVYLRGSYISVDYFNNKGEQK